MHITPDELIGALRADGFRITKSRRAICEVIADAHEEHLSAADIQIRAAARSEADVDPSTVYRTLDVLQQLGYLHHVHLGHGPGLVHLSRDREHHHLVCLTCGRVSDVPLDELRPLIDGVAGRYGYVVDSVHFALAGRCSECAAG